MKNFFSSKSVNEKVLSEIDKKLNDIDKNVTLLFTINSEGKNSSSQVQKKLVIISKEMEELYKCIFDIKKFNMDIFEYFIEKNVINLITSYIGLQNIDLIKIIIPIIHKILFESNILCSKIEITEEIFLMNFSVTNSLKIMIHTLISIFNDNPFDEQLNNTLTIFLSILLNKIILYPNFYFALSSSNNESENNFDSSLFDLIIELFSKEYLVNSRECKAKIRKSLLLCLNLENFYTINISYIEKLLDSLIENLVRYYYSFKMFDPFKYLNENKEIATKLKKDKVSNEDLIELNSRDLISYLKYFSILLHCFSQKGLKKFLTNHLFNKLFLEYIQKDILNTIFSKESDNKLLQIMKFMFYFTKYVNNKETNEIIFYFYFGFKKNPLSEEEGNFSSNSSSNEDLNTNNKKEEIEGEFYTSEDNMISIQEIQLNIDKLVNNNNQKELTNFNIDKNSHKYVNILSFFITIIESNNMSEVKIIFLNILTNLVKNCSNLFLEEILVPYYLNYINGQTNKNFEKIHFRLKSSRDKIDLIEILNNIIPKYFQLDLQNWSEYIDSTLDKNYDRNIFMLENIDLSDSFESSMNSSNSSLFLDNNYINKDAVYSSNTRRFNNSTNFTERFSDSDENLGWIINNNLSKKDIRNYKDNQGTSPTKNNDTSNSINNPVNISIHFYEVLTKYFKNFSTNKYKENLYLTELFLEIYSLPFLIDKGEQGEGLYNVYSNVTFAGKKKFIIYNISSVGTISEIGAKLDEFVRFNFSKEEINKKLASRIKEKQNLICNYNNNNSSKTNVIGSGKKINLQTEENSEFIDNLIIFTEFFKEYLSNVFTKLYFDQINSNYAKALNDIDYIK